MDEYMRAILIMLGRIEEQKRRPQLINAFLGGVMRGLGTTLGVALVGTVIVYLLQYLALANLPGISDFLAEVVTLVQLRLN